MSVDLACQRVDAWRRELAASPASADGLTISVTLSAGIAAFPDHGTDVGSLLLRADEALYRSKREARNRVTCCEKTPAPPPARTQ